MREVLNLWAGRAGMVLTEQLLFALAAFAVNVLFARWLPPDEYGAFALAHSLLQLANTFHTALFTEPLLIFGAGRDARAFARYLSALVRGHWVGTGALCAALAAAGALAFGHPLVRQAFVGLALAVPFVLLLRLMRRACLARLAPHLSALGAGLHLLLVLAGAGLLHHFRAASVLTALLLLGAAGLCTGLWLGLRLRRLGGEAGRGDGREAGDAGVVGWREVRAAHWQYGRWAVGANLLWWVPLNSGVVLLSVLSGLEASATLKAMLNVFMPLVQANAALGALLLPALVTETRRRRAAFGRVLGLSLGLLCGGALLYYLTVGLAARPLVHALYNGRYDHAVGLLWLLGLVPLLDGAAAALSGALRALRRPDRIFWSYLGAAATMLVAALALVPRWGLFGAGLAMVLSFAAAGTLLAAFAYPSARAAAAAPEAASV